MKPISLHVKVETVDKIRILNIIIIFSVFLTKLCRLFHKITFKIPFSPRQSFVNYIERIHFLTGDWIHLKQNENILSRIAALFISWWISFHLYTSTSSRRLKCISINLLNVLFQMLSVYEKSFSFVAELIKKLSKLKK